MKIEKMSKAELIERIEKLSALLNNSGWKNNNHLLGLGCGLFILVNYKLN